MSNSSSLGFKNYSPKNLTPQKMNVTLLLAHSKHLKPFVILLEDSNEKVVPRKVIEEEVGEELNT